MEKNQCLAAYRSPPGYGYEKAGQLTEQVRRKPLTRFVLFVEIEKSDTDVWKYALAKSWKKAS